MTKTLSLLIVVVACSASATLAQEEPAAAPQASPGAKASPPDEDAGAVGGLTAARRQFFVEAMSGLTAEQLDVFWAVYAEYEKEKNGLATERAELVDRFTENHGSGLSDADVGSAVLEMAKLQRRLIDLRLKYFEIYSHRLDIMAAGRFALVDDYVTTSVRLEWLKQVPFPGDAQPGSEEHEPGAPPR